MNNKRNQSSFARIGLSVMACLALTLGGAHRGNAAEYYVSPEGGGLVDGSDWANAFSNVQEAVDAAVTSGDVVYLRYGDYILTNNLVIQSRTNLTLTGGYLGVGAPGVQTNTPSLLRPEVTGNRVVFARDSLLSLADITLSHGDVTGNGGGLLLENCLSTLSNVVVRENIARGDTTYGGGICALDGVLNLVNAEVSGNQLFRTGDTFLYGAGLYCENVTLSVSNTTIQANGILDGDRGGNLYSRGLGGGLSLLNGSALIVDSIVADNYSQNHRARKGEAYGGGLYADNTSPLEVRATVFSGNGCQADSRWPDGSYSYQPIQEGGSLYLVGSSLSANFTDCVIRGNAGVPGVGGVGDVRLAGGNFVMTNCLVALNARGGVIVEGGSLLIANSTIADNTGWGLKRMGGSVTLIDSIVWGNLNGGVDGTVSATYSCTQEPLTGVGNRSVDPLFVGDYYLAKADLPGQTLDSPLLNVGSDTAANLGLDERTTRTDGAFDGGTVDLGYHYASAFGGDMLNLSLYVDAALGDDSNDGRAPGAGGAFKTIGRALEAAVRDTVITIAAGHYNLALGETFPLTVNAPHLHLLGAGPALTLIDADGADTQVINAVAPGRLRLSDLTIQKGNIDIASYSSADRTLTLIRGAGLYALGGDVNVSNCIVRDHSINTQISMVEEINFLGGAGIFATGGALTLLDSTLADNTITRSGGSFGFFLGGGLYAEDVTLFVDNSVFVSNRLDSVLTSNYDFYMRGAAIHMKNGQAVLKNCSFADNVINMPHTRYREGFGAALCAERTRPVRMENCVFRRNWAGPLKVANNNRYQVRGGTLYLYNSAEGVLSSCRVLEGDTDLYDDDHGGVEISYVGYGYSAPAIATLWMTNCLIAGNAGNGMTVRDGKGRMEVVNGTVVTNQSWGVGNLDAVAGLTIHNSIVWGNTEGGIRTNAGDVVTYTLSQEAHPGEGNLSSDPLFVNSPAADYRLQEGSPAINAGLEADWMLEARDLAGNPRILRGGVDLGAYELPPPAGTLLMMR